MIGIFDSGVGGLAVWEILKRKLPDFPTIYIADQAYAPYGEKTRQQIIDRSRRVTRHLLKLGARMILVACNTATVNAITDLRASFPDVSFVGIEPAIKPAAAAADRIIVLGTKSTVTNSHYQALAQRYASGKTVWHVAAPDLVAAVERGNLKPTDQLESYLQPLVEQGATALVIGCTHFSFLVPLIRQRWPRLKIFDGRFGTARQVCRLMARLDIRPSSQRDQFFTTGQSKEVRVVDPPLCWQPLNLVDEESTS